MVSDMMGVREMNDINLNEIANNGKALNGYVQATIKAYGNLAIRLHTTAAMVVFHALQHREASALNTFGKGLRVNDLTALKVWIGKHTLVPGETERNPGVNPATLIGYSKDKGFFVRKGLKSEDAFTLDGLLALAPFYDKNVQDKDALTLEKLLAILASAAKSIDTKATNNDIMLPPAITELLGTITKTVDAVKAPANGNEAAHSNVVNG
jgi:hypothetical protein